MHRDVPSLQMMTSASSHEGPLVSSILRICNNISIDIDDSIEKSVKTILCICLKFINKKKLVEKAIPENHVDWDFVENHQFITQDKPSGNLLGDSVIWLKLLDFVSFPDTSLPDSVIRKNYPPLWCILSSVKESKVYSCIQKTDLEVLTFSDVCKLCIANNLEGVIFRSIFEQYISSKIRRNSHVVLSNLMCALADQRHDSEVYLSTMQYLLGIMEVDSKKLSAQITHYREKRQTQQHAWTLKFVQAGKSRPSMRDVVSKINLGMVGSEYGSTTLLSRSLNSGRQAGDAFCEGSEISYESSNTHIRNGGMGSTSFEEFCDVVRFPNSMSRLLRIRCYLLASQGHVFDFTKHTIKLVPADVAKSVNSNSITFPDVESLRMGIESLTMNIAPFRELNLFRERCFVSFAINQRKILTLTQVLHLYIAAYQKKDLWKQCWKGVYPIMSTQISKDVELFVQNVPFATDPFMHIIKTSTPFVA